MNFVEKRLGKILDEFCGKWMISGHEIILRWLSVP